MKSVQYSVSKKQEDAFNKFSSRAFPRSAGGNRKKTVEALIIYASKHIDANELRSFYYENIGG